MPATITEIIVSAGRTVNHPYESYSNLKPSVTLKAQIAEGDDWEDEYKALHAKAERLIEDHKETLLLGIRQIHDMREIEREMTSLERQMASAQQRIELLRKAVPEQRPLLSSEPVELDDHPYDPNDAQYQ